MPRKKRNEHGSQVALFEWASTRVARWPALGLLHSTPNAGKRSFASAAWLRAEGLKPGWPDVELNIRSADGKCSGLFIEHKEPGEEVEAGGDQERILALLNEHGNRAIVSHGWVESVRAIEDHLGIPDAERTEFFE